MPNNSLGNQYLVIRESGEYRRGANLQTVKGVASSLRVLRQLWYFFVCLLRCCAAVLPHQCKEFISFWFCRLIYLLWARTLYSTLLRASLNFPLFCFVRRCHVVPWLSDSFHRNNATGWTLCVACKIRSEVPDLLFKKIVSCPSSGIAK